MLPLLAMGDVFPGSVRGASHFGLGGSFNAEVVVIVNHEPFAVVVTRLGEPILVVNGRGLLRLESHEEGQERTESFGGHLDSSPKGRQSVGVDVAFVQAEHVYGIPERATRFSLRATVGTGVSAEPYRLYNLDVFEYESESNFGLYGSVPFMVAHGAGATTGALLLNSAEMYVDVGSTLREPMDALSASLFPGADAPLLRRIDTHWYAESGIIDLTLFLGPGPKDVYSALSKLTGPPQLPPLFAIAYHQCRWNYRDEADVEAVSAGFTEHNIPMDVMWLDIEHTNGKRYFTWDERLFPTPERMQNVLAETGRKMVTIVDPHIKRDSGYHVHSGATSLGYYVKTPQGSDFEGHCWPGASSYLDFTDARVRAWWAGMFGTYPGSTKSLYTWIDMNEPSVFSGPEVTMPKDMVHLDGTEHRDVHNMYGFYNQMAAYEGNLRLRTDNDRPFVLSRAFFAGSQRYGAIWTGDNAAKWDHLRVATPMLLSLAVSGITFAGADVGGFFGNPDKELLVRWYQAAAFQPFFRGHAHIDTQRREPWLFGEPYTGLIRDAIATRYALLPYVYTLFYEARIHKGPVVRPAWHEFPADQDTFASDASFMLGPAMLVQPVTQPGAATARVYLPIRPAPFTGVWYSFETHERHEGGEHEVLTPLRTIPVYYRGGSVVPSRRRIRRSSALMARDPYTLTFALDARGAARGTVYLDDGATMLFETQSRFSYRELKAAKTSAAIILSSRRIAGNPDAPFDGLVERIEVLGLDAEPTAVSPSASSSSNYPFTYHKETQSLTIKKPEMSIDSDWEVIITMP